jgi:hypothetical protein
MSIEKIKGKDGSLFTIKGKKYIYVGLQSDKTGKKNHTFYGLDGLNGLDKFDLTGISLNDAINETSLNPNESVQKLVKSSIYNEYKVGIPDKLRTMPGLSGAAAFYEIPGPNATPKRLTTISEKEKILDPSNTNYTYRIGTNGPSLQYISEGKIKNISKFIDDYKKMILKKNIPRENNQVTPSATPSSSISPASTPIASSSSPKPSTPVAAPSTPVASSSTPVAAPSTPVAAPSTPVASSSTPAAAPSTPTTSSEKLKSSASKASESAKAVASKASENAKAVASKASESAKATASKASESFKNFFNKQSTTSPAAASTSPASPKPTGGKSRDKKYKKNKTRKFKK